ncbi:type-F conjugative transfer system mating-pair stabilization protein TraN [Paracidovorax anthurii]|uniref:Conjugal transfer mating pair stabilization protein TraN n=1 Tax=Paracidovorax anthurii TaxID=78229 RepID=A0A328ZBZ4_9BURK|nr:type-F conjugative transfer system mating-pair stabilization protein TraN [Paracidovorax anthurii]RAR83568.1 conjugal transfer mating pair stabilization protein TraN [Paracidovorax anthurii]
MPHLKRAIVWFTLGCFVATHAGAQVGPHAEGTAAGQAANPVIRGNITTPSASTVVPGYTATPPERLYHGQPNLSGQTSARLAACATTPNDTVCQALLGARASANTPRDPVSPYDPAVLGARRVAGNPSTALEDIASFYSGCQVDTWATPGSQTRVCRQYTGTTAQSCARTLSVSISRTSSCPPGEWFAQAASGSSALAVQCKPDLPASAQHLRVTNGGVPLAFFDVDMTTALVFPQWVAPLPDTPWWAGGRNGVWVANNRCAGDSCRLTGFIAQEYRQICTGGGGDGGDSACTTERPFLEVYAACPAGTQSGDHIVHTTDSGGDGSNSQTVYLEQTTCYAPTRQPSEHFGTDVTGTVSGFYWTAHSNRPIVGFRLNPAYGPIPQMSLAYERPHTTVTESDHWDDQCAARASDGRCAVTGAARCVDGPATKAVDGAPVTRACWRYETSLSCQFAGATDECAPLAAAGCTPSGSTCRQMNPATGTCEITENTYRCPVPAGTATAARNCPADVFCIAGSCFNTTYTNDADFARSMSFLEAAREAGVYLDTDHLQVFKGEANRCRDRLLANCCRSDPAGSGMSNQSLFGVGSRLVFDALMNSGNREFLYQGMQALLMGGGFSGSFTSYGVTVAVNGTALPAGSAVLYSGESLVVAFDPWSLAIAIVIYIVMSAMSCDEEEGKLAMKEGARLCHSVGTYCSSCIRVLGRCVSCITHTTGKCCFNSVLARVINEQGRMQVGKGWGTAQAPDCSGFTIAQLQSLDFARMDLTEFYASIVPRMPDAGAMQGDAAGRAANCYYGEGRCQ